jgi:hypothetical protein
VTSLLLPNDFTRARVAAVVEAVDALRSPVPFHGRLQVRTARPTGRDLEKSSNSIEKPGAWRAMGPQPGAPPPGVNKGHPPLAFSPIDIMLAATTALIFYLSVTIFVLTPRLPLVSWGIPRILSPARLPIPPRRRCNTGVLPVSRASEPAGAKFR